MISVDEEDVAFSTIIYPADAKGMVCLIELRDIHTYHVCYINLFKSILNYFVSFTGRKMAFTS